MIYLVYFRAAHNLGLLMKCARSLCTLAALFGVLSGATPLTQAETATTTPVGYNTIECLGNSDTYLNINFLRPAAAQVAVASVSGDTITVSSTPNPPGWTEDQFVYAAGTQSNHYYVLVTEGPKEGRYYDILDNTSTTLQVDLAGDTLEGQLTAETKIKIIPHWTFGTLFPDGEGVHPSSSHSGAQRQTSVLVPDLTTPGKDLAAATSYYYYSGANSPGPGWRKAGAANVLANDDIIVPETPLIIRHLIGTPTTVTVVGDVQWNGFSALLNVLAGNTDQDNAITTKIPVPMTLAESRLFESGAFVGSPSHSGAQRQDTILVFDNSEVAMNKAGSASYYYYTGANAPGPGWRKAGAPNVLADDDVVFDLNHGIVIRKKGTPSPETSEWTLKPDYLAAP
jgi:uncharacterized protein (TIGR02597 family)